MSERLTVDDLDAAERQPCEIYTRVMGYHRPTTEFNPGKQAEVRDRVYFQEAKAVPHLLLAAERELSLMDALAVTAHPEALFIDAHESIILR